jgi:putative Mg2+ transporter-C (MgtC) family protein
VATTAGHFIIMLVFPKLERRLPRSRRMATGIQIFYEDGRGVLSTILIRCTELRFAINHVRLDREDGFIESREEAEDMADDEGLEIGQRPAKGTVALHMQVKGKRPISNLVAALSSIDGVREVATLNEDTEFD